MRYHTTIASIGAALTLMSGLAADAGAWCPSTDGATISCSDCTKELTCNYQGAVTITGNNVTLEGGGGMLYRSPRHGITVNGANATIRNLMIDGAAWHGIYYSVDGTAVLENVTVNASGMTGVSAANSNISIYYLDATYNGTGGAGMGKRNGFGDILYSTLEGNLYGGWVPFHNQFGFNMANFYNVNGLDGAHDRLGSGGLYYDNDFYSNGRHGLYLQDNPTYEVNLTDNYAIGNVKAGCKAENVGPIRYSGNNWGNYWTTCQRY